MDATSNGGVAVRELTPQEGDALLDERARKLLGMSGAEFTRRYHAGELDLTNDDVVRLSMLLPVAG